MKRRTVKRPKVSAPGPAKVPQRDGKGGHLTEEEMERVDSENGKKPGRGTARPGPKNYDWVPLYLARLELTAMKVDSAVDAGVTISHVVTRRHEDPVFAANEEKAMRGAKDMILTEAMRRAVHGWEEPVFGSLGKGEGSGQIGTIRKFSDTLLLRLAERTETGSWRQKQQIEQTSTVQFATRAERKAHLEKVRAEMAADRARDNRS